MPLPCLRGVLAATVLTIACAGTAAAASFDCSKAAAPDEIAICANPDLSNLDVQMATLYGVGSALEKMLVDRWGGPLLAKAPQLTAKGA